jgi:hypothetical protein
LDSAQISYEVPLGAVEMGKDELGWLLLPNDSPLKQMDTESNMRF